MAYGNLLVVPHPDWGHLQEKRAMFAKDALPPNHQYIAFFFWLRKHKQPDVWLSLFSNLVLQGGKMEGPSVDDWTAWLQGDMPVVSPMPLHGPGGVATKRRLLAVTPTFTPAIVYSDLYGGLLEMQEKLRRYRDQEDGALRDSYAKSIRQEAARLHLDRDIGIDAAHAPIEQLTAELERYLDDVRRRHMPSGSHVLGVAPAGEMRREMVTAMLGTEFPKSLAGLVRDTHVAARQLVAAVIEDRLSSAAAQQKVLGRAVPALDHALDQAADYAARLDRTPEELDRILSVFDGRYLEPGPVNDPVRNPAVLPPGRNSYVFDPAALPTREAWTTAMTLADQMIAQYRQKHGSYPRKVGFVLWSSETVSNLGVNEAQMLYLLGVRPVWSSNGQVADVELIPSAELKRPRIDVFATVSGLYRDHFLDKILLIDKAVRLAATARESGNHVAEATAEVRKALLASGESAQTADELSTARIFSEAVGSYSPNTQFLAKSGDMHESGKQMTDLYTSRLSHVYGAGGIGKFSSRAFAANLKGIDAMSFSRSSNVLGTLEHPMVAAYFGGLSMASRQLTGKSADMYISNLADPGSARTETLSRYMNREMRSRYFNPKWVKGMMDRGYDGARFPAAFASNLQFWNTTTPDVVTSDHWQETRDVYVRDKYKLGVNEFFEKNNPFAKQTIAATLLDAAASGHWQATDAEKAEVARALAESAAAHGLACEADLCRNRALVSQMRDTLGASAETAPLLEKFQAALNTVHRSEQLSAAPAIQTMPAALAGNRASSPAPPRRAAPSPAAKASGAAPTPGAVTVKGRVIEPASKSGSPLPRKHSFAAGIFGALVVLLLVAVGWWRAGLA
jgi:cobaltochelatase CobN